MQKNDSDAPDEEYLPDDSGADDVMMNMTD